MCGRFALFRWSPAFAALPGFPQDQQAQWNISPGDSVLMQRNIGGELQLARARWGLTPPWLTDMSRTPAHARAETLAEQPMLSRATAPAPLPVACQRLLRVARHGAQAALLADAG